MAAGSGRAARTGPRAADLRCGPARARPVAGLAVVRLPGDRRRLLPQAAQELLRSARNLRQELVTGYLRELLDRPAHEFAADAAARLAALRTAQMPYLFVSGNKVGPDYLNWLNHVLPQASVTEWPASGPFPHLAHPRRFAECLAATARWAEPAGQP